MRVVPACCSTSNKLSTSDCRWLFLDAEGGGRISGRTQDPIDAIDAIDAIDVIVLIASTLSLLSQSTG